MLSTVDSTLAILAVSTLMIKSCPLRITFSFERRLLKGILKIVSIHQLFSVAINDYKKIAITTVAINYCGQIQVKNFLL